MNLHEGHLSRRTIFGQRTERSAATVVADEPVGNCRKMIYHFRRIYINIPQISKEKPKNHI